MKHIQSALLTLALICLMGTPALAEDVLGGKLSVTSSVGWFKADGYLQTPAGGTPGTSDLKRPKLEEIDIEELFYTEHLINWERGPLTIYGGFTILGDDSSGTLSSDLMSRQQFYAGERYAAKMEFNQYKLGTKYTFKSDFLGGVDIKPMAEVTMMDFVYVLDTGRADIERSYMKPTFRVGGEISKQVMENLDVAVYALSSIPISNTPMIIDSGLIGTLWFFDRTFGVGLEAKTSFLDYEDNQELPNHLRLEADLALLAKITYSF